MMKPPSVHVLSPQDVSRIEMMIEEFRYAMETLFERRLVEPMSCPDDTADFSAVANRLNKDPLF